MTSLCFLACQVSGFFGDILRPHICMYRFPTKTGIWAFVCGQKSNSGVLHSKMGEKECWNRARIFFLNYACHRIALFGHFGSRHNWKGRLTSPFLCNSKVSVVDKNQNQSHKSFTFSYSVHTQLGIQLSAFFSVVQPIHNFSLREGHGGIESVSILP